MCRVDDEVLDQVTLRELVTANLQPGRPTKIAVHCPEEKIAAMHIVSRYARTLGIEPSLVEFEMIPEEHWDVIPVGTKLP